MPVHEIGYRPWEGIPRGPLFRWWVITRAGIKLAWQGKLLRRLLFVAWAPLLYFAPLFFAFGYVTDPSLPAGHSIWHNMLESLLPGDLARQIVSRPREARPVFWAVIFHYFFTYAQSWLTMMVVAIVGPALISQDLRNKTYLLYFAKPITRLDYIAGKLLTVLFFVGMVTLLPALALYVISIAFSPSISTVADTGMIVLDIFAAWASMALPLALLVLLLSSLTKDSRLAVFGWMSIWIVGEFIFRVLEATRALRDSEWIFLTSIRQTTVVLTQSIFGAGEKLAAFVGPAAQPGALDGFRLAFRRRWMGGDVDRLLEHLTVNFSATWAFVFLAVLSLICLRVLFSRVSAPMRI